MPPPPCPQHSQSPSPPTHHPPPTPTHPPPPHPHPHPAQPSPEPPPAPSTPRPSKRSEPLPWPPARHGGRRRHPAGRSRAAGADDDGGHRTLRLRVRPLFVYQVCLSIKSRAQGLRARAGPGPCSAEQAPACCSSRSCPQCCLRALLLAPCRAPILDPPIEPLPQSAASNSTPTLKLAGRIIKRGGPTWWPQSR